MCGIFGVVFGHDSGFSRADTEYVMKNLFILSESRGKEASGVALKTSNSIYIAKYPLPASEIIKLKEFKEIYDRAFSARTSGVDPQNKFPVCIVGHSRLVTNGGKQIHKNNQPAIGNGMVAIHNGIITNVDDLWEKYPALERSTDLDTEILLGLIRHFFQKNGNLESAVRETYQLIEGVASLAVLFEDLNNLLLATNNGSLYLGINKSRSAYIFASENYVLKTLLGKGRLKHLFYDFDIHQVLPGTGYLLNLDNLTPNQFSIQQSITNLVRSEEIPRHSGTTIDISPLGEVFKINERVPGDGPYILSPSFKDEFPGRRDAIAHLRRCTKCVLPETMPFIDFDENGVCNYCRHYNSIGFKGIEALEKDLSPYRKQNGEADCLVTFSGGRDSSYSVHLMKAVLKMNPVTYTYDWGMVTDLARRNQMRICGKLGLEHILVSADITQKRNNIRKNVLAWLKDPDLGTVPIFMAGDKQYFYYMKKVSQQVGTNLIILGENLLETTQFKYGFCGIPPRHGSSHTYTLSLGNKFRLALYYASRYIKNPDYINSSLFDTVGAYLSYYFISHNYINIFEYVKWDEDEIYSTLVDEYNWETASDTKNTWRIGDGTAAFYNYVYYTIAGLTENDTFRSNQIREGMINREEALRLIGNENQPRYESMQWYCDIIGINFDDTVQRINQVPTLYSR